MPLSLVSLAVLFFLCTFLAEGWVRERRGLPFDRRDGARSVAMGIGFLVINLAIQGLLYAFFKLLYDHRVVDLGNAAWVWVAALIVDDLVFYWAHRVSHEVRFFWATHEAHHSSEQYTLTTALRQPWTEPMAMVFWIPMPLLGFRPEMILASHAISLLYQYWIHTELIDRLGPFEWIMNTPSHHRVHHGSNPRYIDKNHGGIFVVWDRLFGTFQIEDEKPVYGLTRPLLNKAVFHASFHEWIAIARDVRLAASWRERLGAVFGRTGRALATARSESTRSQAIPIGA